MRGDTEAASREATAPMQPATPRSPLLAVAVAFASGIAWNLYAPATAPVYLALASVPVVATLCFHRRAGRRVMTLCLLLAVACAGALRHHAAGSMVAPAALARLVTSARQLVQLEGVIAPAASRIGPALPTDNSLAAAGRDDPPRQLQRTGDRAAVGDCPRPGNPTACR